MLLGWIGAELACREFRYLEAVSVSLLFVTLSIHRQQVVHTARDGSWLRWPGSRAAEPRT